MVHQQCLLNAQLAMFISTASYLDTFGCIYFMDVMAPDGDQCLRPSSHQPVRRLKRRLVTRVQNTQERQHLDCIQQQQSCGRSEMVQTSVSPVLLHVNQEEIEPANFLYVMVRLSCSEFL
ncbi:uncharacterized protein LOC111085705 [Limulus polyphemus]|uniref:Uncharacterized protein LOC111085705 n=1 Tax=Limulus polyphemus TaxID=6850 RepID=A0ABM1SCB6_LIMPO|nr:uncharacterized protein LOC111085705 [Limulus polyphemus]